MAQSPEYHEVILMAINSEQEAADLYTDLANRSDNPAAKKHFTMLAKMEQGHKAKLESMDTSFFTSQEVKPPVDLKISDYLVDVEITPDSSYQDTLLYAAKREKAAFDLYNDLANSYAESPEISKMFQVLAQEEAYHKLLMEKEYDDNVYKEN